MEIRSIPIADLLDIEALRSLCNDFSGITDAAIAILDLAGNILVATGWQEICTRFHRRSPETACRCRESDTTLANELERGEDYHVYRCANGMVDVAMPITVAETHVANLYTGQFFFEPPDEAFFLQQARRFGFDEPAYLDALRKVPVIPQEKARMIMGYLSSLARLFGEMGHARTRLEESNRLLTLQIEDTHATFAALQESEEKFRSMAANIPGAVYRMHVRGDGSSSFSYFSPHARELFGTEVPADATYEQLCGRLHPDDTAPFLESIRRAVAEQRPWDREARLLMPDGSVKWIHGISSPTRIGGELVFDGVLLDISEQKRLEDRLLQAQKMESVGFLAGGIAHDLNNLLTPILGYAHMLQKAPGFGSFTEIGQLIQAAEKARDLTQRLLSFSHKQTILLKVVRLGDVVRPFTGILRRTIRENVSIEVKMGPQAGLVRVDPVQVEQVLLNLAVNAQDAMPQGGTLTIEVRDAQLDASQADGAPDAAPGPYTMLRVRDTGIGMDEEVIRHVFEPFYTTKGIGKGTGLGLSTVYGIVKRHGGTITVRSEKNVGSVFCVYFPHVQEEPAQAEQAPRVAAEVPRGTETILVVDDSELVGTVTAKMLENLGYRVLLANTAETCTELARNHPQDIQLLLADVIMPKMNGHELYESIRPLRPKMKVVYMSGYTDDEIGKHGVLDEKTLLVMKPFSANDLAAMVRRALDA